MYLTWKALAFRKAHPGLFQEGAYLPLRVSGERKEHVVAFARHERGDWVLVAVPRLVAGLVAAGRLPVGRRAWKDTAIGLPAKAPKRWANVLTGETLTASRVPDGQVIHLHSIFLHLPFALVAGTSM
jgi:(1->4)-alpha-D-glucan 1-alpha-D-glucosylmutase